MESYAINDVERLTGIKAHTLRIWEKRYHKLIPHRTTTNIRYYDDEQVKKLLNIATLQEHGYKISHLMAMEDSEMNRAVAAIKDKETTDTNATLYVNELSSAMISFNEVKFENLCATIITRYGMFDAMLKVIYPFLYHTGLLWSTSNIMPAQEHFASQLIRRKLAAAIDRLPFPAPGKKKFLLFLSPGHWHDIGLLFADYIIRNEGHQTLYLGQSLPLANLRATIEKTQPDLLLTFMVPMADSNDILMQLMALARAYSGQMLFICSKGQQLPQGDLPNVKLLEHPDQLFAYL